MLTPSVTRLRSSYNPLVCHSVILSLPVHLLLCSKPSPPVLSVHLLLCLTSPHPSSLSTCYSVFHHPTCPLCPPVTLSYIAPPVLSVHLLLCLKPPHPPIYFILFLFCLHLPIWIILAIFAYKTNVRHNGNSRRQEDYLLNGWGFKDYPIEPKTDSEEHLPIVLL